MQNTDYFIGPTLVNETSFNDFFSQVPNTDE